MSHLKIALEKNSDLNYYNFWLLGFISKKFIRLTLHVLYVYSVELLSPLIRHLHPFCRDRDRKSVV